MYDDNSRAPGGDVGSSPNCRSLLVAERTCRDLFGQLCSASDHWLCSETILLNFVTHDLIGYISILFTDLLMSDRWYDSS
jgi:hypothetical protein